MGSYMASARRAVDGARRLAAAFLHHRRLPALCLIAAAFLSVDASAYRQGRSRPTARAIAAAPQRSAEDPLQIVISIGSQRLFVYDRIGLLESSTISTGVGGYPTPTGIFSVLDKEWRHYSNIYGAAAMPFMQRLTMSGVALHSGMVTGRPASHGCVRLPHAFAVGLFKLTKLGTRVVIATNAPAPVEITHPRLFVHKPVPAAPEDKAERDATPRAIAIAIANAAQVDKGIVDARLGKITAERWRMLDAMPISVFISAMEGKVFVRHGFRPLFDAPLVIRMPELRLGTHLYTAVDFRDATRTQMRWQVLSMPPESARGELASRKVSRASMNEAEVMLQGAHEPPATAAEALERVALPQEALERISELLSPGASLIISDHGFNREMRENGTDFIVLTH
jgi:hypothetical protein